MKIALVNPKIFRIPYKTHICDNEKGCLSVKANIRTCFLSCKNCARGYDLIQDKISPLIFLNQSNDEMPITIVVIFHDS